MTKTVLVVDDDPTQRRLIQAVLEREGFAVSHADSGDAAIAHLTSGAPADVILLDLVMPGLSGQDALAEMRARGFSQPVIVLTASGGVDTVVKAMQAGACDFFIKPASPERITVSIRNALSMGDLKGEVERLTQPGPPDPDGLRERRCAGLLRTVQIADRHLRKVQGRSMIGDQARDSGDVVAVAVGGADDFDGLARARQHSCHIVGSARQAGIDHHARAVSVQHLAIEDPP